MADEQVPDCSATATGRLALPTLSQFVDAVISSGLLVQSVVATELAAYREVQSGEPSVTQFARWLIRRDTLTRYQAERLLAGRTDGFFIGGCRLLDKLGAGGMGQVYLAEQTKLARKVAIKVLPRRLAADPEFVARFAREARAVAALKHPNVVQIYDVGEERGVHYLVMEHLSGETLSNRLARKGVLSTHESVWVIRQVALGLAHAHANRIVHRDIKPANLLIENGVVKILDLGLARVSQLGETVTKEIQVFGTPDYMSPEQCTDARTADARSDLYSLGCTWFALLTGQVPFPDGTAIAKVMAHLHSPPPLDRLPPSVSEPMRSLVGKLLAKLPQDRPQSAEALLVELRRFGDEKTATRLSASALAAATSSAAPAWDADTEAIQDIQTATSENASSEMDSPLPLAPTPGDAGGETLVQKPTTGVPSFLLYLVPTMAALVLGGAYFGIEAIRKQAGRAETVFIEIPARDHAQDLQSRKIAPAIPSEPAALAVVQTPEIEIPQQTAVNAQGGQATADQEMPISHREPEAASKLQEPPAATLAAMAPDILALADGETSLADSRVALKELSAVASSRPPRTWPIATTTDFTIAWSEAVDGDRLELAAEIVLRLDQLELQGKSIELYSPARAAIVLEVGAGASDGIWRISNSTVKITGVDFYVRSAVASSSQAVLINAIESDVHLAGCTVTLISEPGDPSVAMTVVHLSGQRSWVPAAGGEPPTPLALEARDLIVRGAESLASVESLQAEIRVSNALVITGGPMIRVRHSSPLETAHQGLEIEISNATLDVAGPLLAIETRPYELVPARTVLTMRRSLLAAGPAPEPPPQVAWLSPVSTQVVSESFRWVSQNNLLSRRGPGLVAKTSAGPIATLAISPQDWQAQGIGIDEDSVILRKLLQLPRTAHDRRLPQDYPSSAQLARLREGRAPGRGETVGADVRKITPRTWTSVQAQMDRSSMPPETSP